MAVSTFNIPAALAARFEELEQQGKYPIRRSMLVPALHLAQEHYGWISDAAYGAVCEFLELPHNYVKGIASFYSMFFLEPPGKYVIQVCHNIGCYLENAEDLVVYIEKKLGVKCGKTTPDGKFTLVTVECLAACGRGPVVQINNREYHEYMSPEKIDRLLESLV